MAYALALRNCKRCIEWRGHLGANCASEDTLGGQKRSPFCSVVGLSRQPVPLLTQLAVFAELPFVTKSVYNIDCIVSKLSCVQRDQQQAFGVTEAAHEPVAQGEGRVQFGRD